MPTPSPYFSSRPVMDPAQPPAPPPLPSVASPIEAPLPLPASVPPPPKLRPDELRYYGSQEKLVLAFDVGNSYSSVTLTHLKWGSSPLSTSSATTSTSGAAIRTVITYPFSTPALTPVPSRMPSLIMYDRHDRPRAIGAECLLPEVKERAREEGWILVKGWKDQMRPLPSSTSPAKSPSSVPGKLTKKKTTTRSSAPLSPASRASFPSALSVTPTPHSPSFASLLTSSSTEGLLDAIDARTEVHGTAERLSNDSSRSRPVLLGPVDGGSGALAGIAAAAPEKKRKEVKLHAGPKLRDIYRDVLPHLVACARAWFTETTSAGEQTFLRLWPTCVFVFAHPADWGSAETDLVREAVEAANLLPADFRVGRLVFLKESAAITYFAKRHTRDAERTWLQEGRSFALCDAAEAGVSVIGYTVMSVYPKLKLRAYEPVSRLPAGSLSVLYAFRELLNSRLGKTKFRSPSIVGYLENEFRTKVLPKFSGLEDGAFKLRIQPELGAGGDAKVEKGIDTGAKVRDGWMSFSPRDVEGVFKPSVDAIIVRLSSTLPRGDARHILLSGGFGESPYLVRRLKETFEPVGTSLVIPDIPTHASVSEGALRFYLSETLRPRKTRFALGVQTAVDWRTTTLPGARERELYEGSGGQRLVMGRFGVVVPQDSPLDPTSPWRKTFNFKYRLAALKPLLYIKLFAHDPSLSMASSENEDGSFDGWMTGPDGKTRPEFLPVCEVAADLYSLVVLSKAHGEPGKEWVQLEVELAVGVGEGCLEASIVWRENGKEVSGAPSRIEQKFF
ncbi:hypothetical protein JCM10213_006270 [Rhodosporidiobolus nylandii]